MPKFGSREEYEQWKTQRMEQLGVKPTEPDPVEQHEQYEQQSAPPPPPAVPMESYPAEGGGDAGGGTGRWVFVFVVLAVVGVAALFLFGGKSKAPETAPEAVTQPAPESAPETAPEASNKADTESAAKPFVKKGTRSTADLPPPKLPESPMERAAAMGDFMRRVEDARAAHADHISRVRDEVDDLKSNGPARVTAELTLDNKTDTDVYVKIVGEGDYLRAANVPSHGSSTMRLRSGSFYLKMRYQGKTGYNYQRGDDFNLPSNSKTTITLHKVPAGNYGSSSMSAADF